MLTLTMRVEMECAGDVFVAVFVMRSSFFIHRSFEQYACKHTFPWSPQNSLTLCSESLPNHQQASHPLQTQIKQNPKRRVLPRPMHTTQSSTPSMMAVYGGGGGGGFVVVLSLWRRKTPGHHIGSLSLSPAAVWVSVIKSICIRPSAFCARNVLWKVE